MWLLVEVEDVDSARRQGLYSNPCRQSEGKAQAMREMVVVGTKVWGMQPGEKSKQIKPVRADHSPGQSNSM